MTDSTSSVQAITEEIKGRWVSFLLLGIAFILGGALAIALPVVSSLATSLTVGLLLVACGVIQVIQAFQTKGWRGFLWHLAVGIIQVVGGGMIYFDPFAGAIAITMVITIVLIVQGFAQVALAFQVRPFDGWGWLLFAGIVAIVAGGLIAAKLPFAGLAVPGTMVGLSLLFTGAAYVAIALAARRIVKAAAAA